MPCSIRSRAFILSKTVADGGKEEIVTSIHLMGMTLTDFAASRGISKQSAHERLAGAMKKMRKTL